MIAGIIIIAIGAAVLIGTLAFNGWSFKRPEFEMLEYSEYSGDTIEIDSLFKRLQSQNRS